MSTQNPNVFYEVGYAHGKEKLCILITAEPSDIPFDLKHRRHIVHNNSIKLLREQLKEELTWAKTEIENTKKSRIKVNLKNAYGTLEKTKYLATGKIEITIDLLNELRFYFMGHRIRIFLHHHWAPANSYRMVRLVHSTLSNIPDFQKRHFLILSCAAFDEEFLGCRFASMRSGFSPTLPSRTAGIQIFTPSFWAQHSSSGHLKWKSRL